MTAKPCSQCHTAPRAPGHRYCRSCKAGYMRSFRAASLNNLARLVARYPQFTLRKAQWTAMAGENAGPAAIPNDWWAATTPQGTFYGPNPKAALTKALKGSV